MTKNITNILLSFFFFYYSTTKMLLYLNNVFGIYLDFKSKFIVQLFFIDANISIVMTVFWREASSAYVEHIDLQR